jgi:hypothetical protein
MFWKFLDVCPCFLFHINLIFFVSWLKFETDFSSILRLYQDPILLSACLLLKTQNWRKKLSSWIKWVNFFFFLWSISLICVSCKVLKFGGVIQCVADKILSCNSILLHRITMLNIGVNRAVNCNWYGLNQQLWSCCGRRLQQNHNCCRDV